MTAKRSRYIECKIGNVRPSVFPSAHIYLYTCIGICALYFGSETAWISILPIAMNKSKLCKSPTFNSAILDFGWSSSTTLHETKVEKKSTSESKIANSDPTSTWNIHGGHGVVVWSNCCWSFCFHGFQDDWFSYTFVMIFTHLGVCQIKSKFVAHEDCLEGNEFIGILWRFVKLASSARGDGLAGGVWNSIYEINCSVIVCFDWDWTFIDGCTLRIPFVFCVFMTFSIRTTRFDQHTVSSFMCFFSRPTTSRR